MKYVQDPSHPLPAFSFILLCSEIDSYVSKIRFITRPDLNTRNRKLFMGHNITSERDNLLKSQQAQESFIKQPNSEHISTLTPSLSDQNCVTVCQNQVNYTLYYQKSSVWISSNLMRASCSQLQFLDFTFIVHERNCPRG